MASPAPGSGCTFINLTEDPEKGRHARRISVRRAVMLDYHKRRKPQGKRAQVLLGAPPLEVPSVGSGGGEACPPEGSVDDSSSVASSLQLWSTYLFQPRHWEEEQHTQTSSLIIRFLCGQTRKAALDMSYVAFVHRQFNGAVTDPSNPLKVCEEILRIYSEGGDSDKALWEMVCKEQERIYSQLERFNKWELLSATQAVTLYILLWLRKGTNLPTFPCGNIALLFTLGKAFNLLKALHLHGNPALLPARDWQSWIYRESSLRTAAVYFILTLVLSMDFGFGCDRPEDWRLLDMPVPAKRGVWDAGREVCWRGRAREGEGVEGVEGMLLFKDLRDPRIPAIDTWEEDLDEFGLIVAMVARLPLTEVAK